MNAEAQRKLIFTPEEASLRLPLVQVIVKDIIELFQNLNDRQERIAEIKRLPGASARDEESAYSEELIQAELDIENDLEQLKGYVSELIDLGVELEDPGMGVVNFPALREGKEISLCWKYGEEEIAYWHHLDEGFSDRQLLFEESLKRDSEKNDDDPIV